MSLIKEKDLRDEIKAKGHTGAAEHFAKAIKEKELSYLDFPGVRCLYENFINTNGQSSGRDILEGYHTVKEEAGAVTSTDGYSILTSQLYFDAFTTFYEASDFTIYPLCRSIPSNLPKGEYFGGLTNLNTAIQPVAEGREFISLSPSQDYSKSPSMQNYGATLDVTMQMARADQTGQILNYFERLGSTMGTSKELEAVQALTGIDCANLGLKDATRSRYKWLDSTYDTYNTSLSDTTGGWVNAVGSTKLLNWDSLNTLYQLANNILDPFTKLPIVTPKGRMKLIVCPELAMMAARLKAGLNYRTVDPATAGTNASPLVVSEVVMPFDFDIVVSKYVKYVADNNGGSSASWYIAWPEMALSFQTMFPITMAAAVEGTGDLYRRNLAFSYKTYRTETIYVFNPRYLYRANPS